MSLWKLAWRGVVYDRRVWLAVGLAVVVAGAVLIGAMVVGDCVKGTLKSLAMDRIGRVRLAMVGHGRFFRAELESEIAEELKVDMAAILAVDAVAGRPDGRGRANSVQLFGVTESFYGLGPGGHRVRVSDDGVVINEALAGQLDVEVGDQVVLRFEKPSALSRDMVLTSDQADVVGLRLAVKDIVGVDRFGRFSLQVNQQSPYNAFVSRAILQQAIGQAGMANLLLVGGDVPVGRANQAFRNNWQLADAGLKIKKVAGGQYWQLQSVRVFLDDAVVRAADVAGDSRQKVLSYLVNELRIEDRVTPYSIVAAVSGDFVSYDRAIVINQWLADDLQAMVGDPLTLRYYVVGLDRKLEQQTAEFTISQVVPMEGKAVDRDLMPPFPGIADSENCRDWQAGSAIDLAKIRDEDEQYWEQYGGSPKAFISLEAGQKLWANRFGQLTGVRYPTAEITEKQLTSEILANMKPGESGLTFRDVYQSAMAAANPPTDFAGLFLGLSMFLIAASIILVGLLFVFVVEKRSDQIGVMLAVGLTGKQIRKVLWIEGLLVTCAVMPLAVVAGLGYAKVVMVALNTVWAGATASAGLEYHAKVLTVVIGCMVTIVIVMLAIGFTGWRRYRLAVSVLLGGGDTHEYIKRRSAKSLVVAIGSMVAAIALLLLVRSEDAQSQAAVFFMTGGIMLVAVIAFSQYILNRLANITEAQMLSIWLLAARNNARRSGRSLAITGLLATGCFLTIAISVFQVDSTMVAGRAGGTGGFALYGESTRPIFESLPLSDDRHVVRMRLKQGDDASCLNLNMAQQPTIVAVDPSVLAERGAFTFVSTLGNAQSDPWLMLDQELADDVIPVIADDATIKWALKKKLGEEIAYRDDAGSEIKLRLVGALKNSIFQGQLVMSKDHFVEHFPSEAGDRLFLIDVRPDDLQQVQKDLTYTFADYGLQVTLAKIRLATFAEVQNTYLSIFQSLGGLALILGSVGVAVVVLRNVLERRKELAVMSAVGLRRRRIMQLIFVEHAMLLLSGVVGGTVAAIVAVGPAVVSLQSAVPIVSILILCLAVVVVGAMATALATRMAVSRMPVSVLQGE